jgi:hypothetical protein
LTEGLKIHQELTFNQISKVEEIKTLSQANPDFKETSQQKKSIIKKALSKESSIARGRTSIDKEMVSDVWNEELKLLTVKDKNGESNLDKVYNKTRVIKPLLNTFRMQF